MEGMPEKKHTLTEASKEPMDAAPGCNAGQRKRNSPQVSGPPSTQLGAANDGPPWAGKREASSAGPEGAAEEGSVRPEPARPPAAAAAVGAALPGEADSPSRRRPPDVRYYSTQTRQPQPQPQRRPAPREAAPTRHGTAGAGRGHTDLPPRPSARRPEAAAEAPPRQPLGARPLTRGLRAAPPAAAAAAEGDKGDTRAAAPLTFLHRQPAAAARRRRGPPPLSAGRRRSARPPAAVAARLSSAPGAGALSHNTASGGERSGPSFPAAPPSLPPSGAFSGGTEAAGRGGRPERSGGVPRRRRPAGPRFGRGKGEEGEGAFPHGRDRPAREARSSGLPSARPASPRSLQTNISRAAKCSSPPPPPASPASEGPCPFRGAHPGPPGPHQSISCGCYSLGTPPALCEEPPFLTGEVSLLHSITWRVQA